VKPDLYTGWSPSTLHAAGSIDSARVLARLLVLGVAFVIFALFVTPWQQSITGSGRVIAYAPLERRQSVEAPIPGRVVHWHVQEGEHVEAGAALVDLADNDPQILERLERERDAVESKAQAATLAIAVTEAKITALEGARSASLSGASLERRIAEDRRDAARRAVDAAEATHATAKLNVERQRRLHARGLASTRVLELAELELQTTEAALDRAQATLAAASREIKAALADRDAIAGDTQADIEDARASLQKARADRAEAEAELAKIDVRLARQSTMRVTAPRAGAIFRIVAKQGGEMVDQGEELVVLVPDTEDRAVELWVDGNDAPLVTPGRRVRIQFEGWPAVQFVGWPSVAVGTFGGTVAFVDATDDGRGGFRILVVPDEEEPWPASRYLRQGVRANGWVLLDRVSLGYELWRQLNGFPPAVAPPPDAAQVGSPSPDGGSK
jgi:adhesin transport system membrane fusion protein